MPRTLPILLLIPTLLVACDAAEPDPPPRPLEEASASDTPSPQEQAERVAENPRLLLFDLETALESARAARGSYPTTAEFEADDRWSLHRAALDAAFDDWSYVSDGDGYGLEGSRGGRTLSIGSGDGGGS